MTDKSGSDGRVAGSGVPAEKAAAEAKRLAARRRFLLGGASALPLIVTLGTKEAWAASAAVCESLNVSYDREYVWQEIKKQYYENSGDDGTYDSTSSDWDGHTGLSVSLFCDPSKRWS